MAQKIFEVSIPGGDRVTLKVELEGTLLRAASWGVVGRMELIEAAQKLKNQMHGEVGKIPIPAGNSPAQLMLKQLVLRLKGLWPETNDSELCHCRKIPQVNVERAVILGAHSVEKVRQRTSANTGCGTCLPDVEKILELYLK